MAVDGCNRGGWAPFILSVSFSHIPLSAFLQRGFTFLHISLTFSFQNLYALTPLLLSVANLFLGPLLFSLPSSLQEYCSEIIYHYFCSVWWKDSWNPRFYYTLPVCIQENCQTPLVINLRWHWMKEVKTNCWESGFSAAFDLLMMTASC